MRDVRWIVPTDRKGARERLVALAWRLGCTTLPVYPDETGIDLLRLQVNDRAIVEAATASKGSETPPGTFAIVVRGPDADAVAEAIASDVGGRVTDEDDLAIAALWSTRPRPGSGHVPRSHTAIDFDDAGGARIASAQGEVHALDLDHDGALESRVLVRDQWTLLSLALTPTHVWFTSYSDARRARLSRVPRAGGDVYVVAEDLAWPGVIATDGEDALVPLRGERDDGDDGALLRIEASGRHRVIAPVPSGALFVAAKGGTVAWLTRGGELWANRSGIAERLGRALPTGIAVGERGEVYAVFAGIAEREALARVDREAVHPNILVEKGPGYGLASGDSLVAGAGHVLWNAEFDSSHAFTRRPCWVSSAGEVDYDVYCNAGTVATEMTRALAIASPALREVRGTLGWMDAPRHPIPRELG